MRIRICEKTYATGRNYATHNFDHSFNEVKMVKFIIMVKLKIYLF